MAETILAVLGAACLMGCLHFKAQYYPPGYGYEEERRHRRIAVRLGFIGLAFIAASIAVAVS